MSDERPLRGGENVTDERVEQIRGLHHNHGRGHRVHYCVLCRRRWPCDVAYLLARLDEAEKRAYLAQDAGPPVRW